MPIVLADANLQPMTVDNFFNEFETHVRESITASGFYKIARQKADQMLFTSATLVTEADDAAVLDERNDRYSQIGETEDYLYVHFVL
jgi:chlorite dismutase